MIQVLLVEPDKLLSKTYLSAFAAAGIKARGISNAQDAIVAIDKHRPRLVVLELQLAQHNGVEFLYELRSHSDLGQIPVLLHTLIPDSDLALTEQVKEQLGIVGYLYKPQTSLQQLISAVKGQLS